MLITKDMKVKEVLEIGDQMLDAFFWLAPAFERLRYPKLRKAMSGRVTVEQAARIGRVPLSEALYVLNMAAGYDTNKLEEELCILPRSDHEFTEANPPLKPREILGVEDDDPRVAFVDVMPNAMEHRDPMPDIARGLVSLENFNEILLIRHPFDPIPLRDMFARRGYSSWAEERLPGDWYIYFYRPTEKAKAFAHHSVGNKAYSASV